MEKIVLCGQVDISISVVSHSQISLIVELLNDLRSQCIDSRFEVILTLNVTEKLPFELNEFSWPIKVIRNVTPNGFGANHNQAFRLATGKYFCVMNPDIRLLGDPFPKLIAYLKNPSFGVVAPLVLNTDGVQEESARVFPSPVSILRKILGNRVPDYSINDLPIFPDWVGGMFMVYPMNIFDQLSGFDERYFLYYEDADICARLRLLGYEVVVCPNAKVIHHAQRSSHKSLKYTRWHLRSMIRFFISPVYRQVHRRPKA